MSKKKLVLTLVAHQGYFCPNSVQELSHPEIELLFAGISDTYIPLLNMFETLDLQHVPFKLGIVMTPTLCTLLSDYSVQEMYVGWLDKLILLGERQLEGLDESDSLLPLVKAELERVRKCKDDFINVYKSDLLAAFRYYADRGSIELMATAATAAFLPHYIDLPEAVNAQVEAGLHSHRQFFGLVPDGFWLPAMGYVPGLEEVIKSYGFGYTILDSHGLLFGDPMPRNGIFTPALCHNGLWVFGQDHTAEECVVGLGGFMHQDVYRDQNRDFAFEATDQQLEGFLVENKVRLPSGYKYWTRGDDQELYCREAAQAQARVDAQAFVRKYEEKLSMASHALESEDVSIVCAFYAKDFGQLWHEGMYWLEQVIRLVAESQELELAQCYDMLDHKKDLQQVNPFMSAATGTGYGENFLDMKNDWMLRYARKACQRMNQLADRFPEDTGLKARALNMAAREVLLAQSLDWPKMLSEGLFPEYAEAQFKKNVQSFITVYDSLGANTISTEWLTRLEQEHPLFPWMNYRIFSKKQ